MWVIVLENKFTTITGEEKIGRYFYSGKGPFGMRNYGKLENAKLFRTKKEAKAEAGKTDIIEKVLY